MSENTNKRKEEDPINKIGKDFKNLSLPQKILYGFIFIAEMLEWGANNL